VCSAQAEAYALLLRAALERVGVSERSVGNIFVEPSARVLLKQTIPELFFRTEVPRDRPHGKAVDTTRYPMLLLEAHLAAGGEAIHYAKGFVLFPSWRNLKVENYRVRFDVLHRQIVFSLRHLSPALHVEFEDDLSGRAKRLVASNFRSDVAVAAERVREAQGEFSQGHLDKAEAILTSLAVHLPAMPTAALLLVQCWDWQHACGATPSPEVMKAVALALDTSAQNHKRGLRAIRRSGICEDVGTSEAVLDLEAIQR